MLKRDMDEFHMFKLALNNDNKEVYKDVLKNPYVLHQAKLMSKIKRYKFLTTIV
jgi:hypothetical protein